VALTIFAVEKGLVLNILRLALFICHAKRMRQIILSGLAFLAFLY
jgi:hypothetical protein